MGCFLEKHERREKAAALYEKAREADRGPPYGCAHLGDIVEWRGDFERAEALFHEAIAAEGPPYPTLLSSPGRDARWIVTHLSWDANLMIWSVSQG